MYTYICLPSLLWCRLLLLASCLILLHSKASSLPCCYGIDLHKCHNTTSPPLCCPDTYILSSHLISVSITFTHHTMVPVCPVTMETPCVLIHSLFRLTFTYHTIGPLLSPVAVMLSSYALVLHGLLGAILCVVLVKHVTDITEQAWGWLLTQIVTENKE